MSSPDLLVADPPAQGHLETVTPVQECVKPPHLQAESGQLEASTPTGLRTPTNSIKGILINSASQEGSVFCGWQTS